MGFIMAKAGFNKGREPMGVDSIYSCFTSFPSSPAFLFFYLRNSRQDAKLAKMIEGNGLYPWRSLPLCAIISSLFREGKGRGKRGHAVILATNVYIIRVSKVLEN